MLQARDKPQKRPEAIRPSVPGAGRECRQGPEWAQRPRGGILRNCPSRLRRDSAGPSRHRSPSHPQRPKPRAVNANASARAPDTARQLLAVGWALGLWGRRHCPSPGPCHQCRVPALCPGWAPARSPAPARRHQLLQPCTSASATILRAPRVPLSLPQPPGCVLAQWLALALPGALLSYSHAIAVPSGRHSPENALGEGLAPYLPFSFQLGWGR